MAFGIMQRMVELAFVASQAWFLFLLSLAATAGVFPLVFLASFFYEMLLDKYPKTPKILLMLLVTFLGVFAALTLVEIYLEFTLPLALSGPNP